MQIEYFNEHPEELDQRISLLMNTNTDLRYMKDIQPEEEPVQQFLSKSISLSAYIQRHIHHYL